MTLTSPPSRTGWRVVGVSFLALVIIFGIRLSFAVFFAEFTREEGWSSAASASIFSVSMIAFGIASIPAGIMLDRFGPQIMFSCGAALLGVGLLWSSQATGITYLQVSYGMVAGIALALIGLAPFGAIISGWFRDQHRGLAIGIAFAGTGIGALIFVPLSERLIDELGWRAAYQVLAAICFFILVPLLAIGHKRPPNFSLAKPDSNRGALRAMMKLNTFWWLVLAAFLTMAPVRSLTVHQVAYLQEVGFERSTAAQFVGLAGFLTAGAFIVWGYVSDHYGRLSAFGGGGLALTCAVIILFILQQSQVTMLLAVYSLMFALAEGSRSGQTTALASDTFQGDNLGLINGVTGGMFGIGAAIGPWVLGKLHDSLGNYDAGLIIVVVITFISVFAFRMVLKSHKVGKHA